MKKTHYMKKKKNRIGIQCDPCILWEATSHKTYSAHMNFVSALCFPNENKKKVKISPNEQLQTKVNNNHFYFLNVINEWIKTITEHKICGCFKSHRASIMNDTVHKSLSKY